jgi:hypothetical protein
VAARSAWRPAAGALGWEEGALIDAWQFCLTFVKYRSDCRYNVRWATGTRAFASNGAFDRVYIACD